MSYLKGVLFLTAIAMAAIIWAAHEAQKSRSEREALYREAYRAWVKLEDRPDITYEEWKALKNTGMIRR